jgi:hypothetical protein
MHTNLHTYAQTSIHERASATHQTDSKEGSKSPLSKEKSAAKSLIIGARSDLGGKNGFGGQNESGAKNDALLLESGAKNNDGKIDGWRHERNDDFGCVCVCVYVCMCISLSVHMSL